MKDTPQKPARSGVQRENIANLLQVPKGYKLKPGTTIDDPVFLVDEKPLETRITNIPKQHTRDQLIKMIGLAYPEFVSLVHELDEAKTANVQSCALVAEMFAAATGHKNGPKEGVIEDVRKVGNDNAKMRSILRTIAYENRTAAQAQFMAERFINDDQPVRSDSAIQVDTLAKWIIQNFPQEIRLGRAVDVAISIMQKYKDGLKTSEGTTGTTEA